MVSVHSKNPFDLLAAEDQDETPVVQQKPAKSEIPTQKKNTDKSRARPQDNRIRNDYPSRGGRANKSAPRQENTEGRPAPRGDRPPREERDAKPRDHSDHHRGSRGGYQGGRGRVFDRHSGNHRDSEKKESQGWGEPTASYDDAAPALPPAEEAAVAEEKPEDPEAIAAAAERRRIQEEEEKQKTFEEYLAEKAKATPAVNLPSARKANEGADNSQWKDAVVYERIEEEENPLFTGKEQALKARKQKERPTKTHLDIVQKFAEAPRADRGRGGRGGARGGYNGDRNDRKGGNERSLNMGDENAFPTLGGKK